MHPEFQTYAREILNHHGHCDFQDQNYSFQQVTIFYFNYFMCIPYSLWIYSLA